MNLKQLTLPLILGLSLLFGACQESTQAPDNNGDAGEAVEDAADDAGDAVDDAADDAKDAADDAGDAVDDATN